MFSVVKTFLKMLTGGQVAVEGAMQYLTDEVESEQEVRVGVRGVFVDLSNLGDR